MAAARFTLDQRREAVRVAVQTQKADAKVSLRAANDTEARISALEQNVSERESTRAAAEAAEEDVHVEVQQLEHQEEAANEIESPTRTPTVQPFRKSRRQKRPGPDSDCSQARHGSEQRNPWHSDGAERVVAHAHERHASTQQIRWALVETIRSRVEQPRRTPAAAGSVRKVQ